MIYMCYFPQPKLLHRDDDSTTNQVYP